MEAIGVAAAIFQLAGVGLSLAKTFYSLYDEGSSSKEQIIEMASYIKSTSIALEEVGKIFEEESKVPRPIISQNAITNVNELVSRCNGVFAELSKIAEDGGRNSVGLLLFMIKSSRLRVLQTRLEQFKVDLQLMMQVIIYARLKVEPQLSTKETEQRKAVGDLINKRIEVNKNSREAEHSARKDANTELDDSRILASSGVMTIKLQTSLASPDTMISSQQATTKSLLTSEPRQSRSNPQSPVVSDEEQTPQLQISYWEALYLVLCPCLPRKRAIEVPGPSDRPTFTSKTQLRSMAPRILPSDISGVYELADTAALDELADTSAVDELAQELELDQLLHQWTTIYKTPPTHPKGRSSPSNIE